MHSTFQVEFHVEINQGTIEEKVWWNAKHRPTPFFLTVKKTLGSAVLGDRSFFGEGERVQMEGIFE